MNDAAYAGTVIGAIFGIFIFSLIFQKALRGFGKTKLGSVVATLMAFTLGITMKGFLDASGGFDTRIAAIPQMVDVVMYGSGTLLVAGHFVAGARGLLLSVLPVLAIQWFWYGENFKQAVERDYEEILSGEYRGQSHVMINMLRAHRPEEFRRLAGLLRYAMLKNSNDPEAGRQAINQFFAEFREKYLGDLPRAPDEFHREIFRAQVKLLDAFSSNPEKCNRIIQQGAFALSVTDKDANRDSIEELDNAVVRAMIEGSKHPGAARPLTGDDIVEMIEIWRSGGATDADVNLVFAPQPQNLNNCAVFRSLFSTLATMDGEAAERVRASWFAP